MGNSIREIYPAAIYARLSVENSGKDDEGAAIENQIDVCKEYIRECPDLKLVKVYEDNGWTGTVMRRPAFDEMMEDIRTGKIRAVVVRDLSRFARNYIETGTYLESIFPDLNVRFISVKEQFDTLKTDGSNENLMIPLQNLINDLYAKDISRKVEAALHTQMEEGTFAWRNLPYGYTWNDDHSNIIPDEKTAPFVRNIFEWADQGISKVEIAARLQKMNAPKYQEMYKENPWAKSTVFGIRHSAIYKGIKIEKRPEEDWYVTENAHEPLISRELYDSVKEKLRKNSLKLQESKKRTAKARAGIIDLFDKKIMKR